MAVDTNGAGPDASLENIKPPPGVIIPPPGEIREAIEKTAGYVMRGGLGLEQRIRDNHGSNPKFNFLMTASDPYNAYYEWRKDEIRAGRGTAVSAGRAGPGAAAPASEAPQRPPQPPDYHFSPRMPRMSQKDLEIVRLAALFVAKNGRPFLTQLAQRETSNPQFQFLMPNHTFHNFFQSTVDQYTTLLRDSGVSGDGTKAQEVRVSDLRENVADRGHVLARARQRAEFAKWQEREKAKAEEEEEKKREEFASIDWNDFVVVETIVFSEADERAQLPPPTTLNDLEYASLEEKNKASISANLRIEEAFPFDDTDYNAYPPQSYGAQAQPPSANLAQASVQLPSRGGPGPPGEAAPGAWEKSAQEEEEEQRIQERELAKARMHQAQNEARGNTAPVKIKDNYVPRAAARAANRTGTPMTICPNCKQQVPMSELEEHMRIELLDPQWKEQKAKADARYATTNLSTADVAKNLKRLASQRTDVFETTSGENLTDEEQARRKKVALNSFDGNPEGRHQGVNVEEQIRAIHQRFSDKK